MPGSRVPMPCASSSTTRTSARSPGSSVLRALDSREVRTAEARAAMSIADWREMLATPIDGAPIAIPPYIFGGTEEDRRAAYADYLSDRASAAAPMVALYQAIEGPPR